MQPTNLLFILSDQHCARDAGFMGHEQVHTPHLDTLAAAGTTFTAAYTPCPICVPARAALATGRYVHRLRAWDNAFPFQGETASWHSRLRENGLQVASIGKLHFRGPQDDNGFTTEINPLHIVDGKGDLLGCIRKDPPRRDKRPGILNAGPGNSTYLDYDRQNTEQAVAWLRAHQADEQPWTLFLSYVCPHPPYIAPKADYDRYPQGLLTEPPQSAAETWPDHPALAEFRRFFRLEQDLGDPVMRNMMAAYFGACTFLDGQIGRVLNELDNLGLTHNTRIIYTSDHGESHGARGLYGKFTMYDDACAVPFVMCGPGIPAGHREATPISLLDCHPTILESADIAPTEEDDALPGKSLFRVLQDPPTDRTVFSEYHAVGSQDAHYMIRTRRYKYIHYIGRPPQLFDMVQDSLECHNVAASADYQQVLQECERRLHDILDPVEVNAQAHRDQERRVRENGGRNAVIKRGAFDNSPVPGEAPQFRNVTG